MSELDKTIEELEAEVQKELEEASQDMPQKGADKGDSMEKVEGEVQDLVCCCFPRREICCATMRKRFLLQLRVQKMLVAMTHQLKLKNLLLQKPLNMTVKL